MKILAIMGTYRKDGTTNRLVETALRGAERAGASTEKIFLTDLEMAYCRNCIKCWERPELKLGKCPLEDDVAGVLRKISRADGLILATPTNYMWPTGITKVFMERMGPVFRKRGKGPGVVAEVPVQRFSAGDNPRKGLAIISCYGSTYVALPGIKMLRDMFKSLNVKEVKTITCAWQYGGLYPLEKRPLLLKKIEKAGFNLVG